MLARPIALERFESISRRHSEVIDSACDFQLPQLSTSDGLHIDETTHANSGCELAGIGVTERDNHIINSNALR
jgi:hypothetical protein